MVWTNLTGKVSHYTSKYWATKSSWLGELDLFVTKYHKIPKKASKKGISLTPSLIVQPDRFWTEIPPLSRWRKTLAALLLSLTVLGETEDVTIADLAVGTAAGQIKTGSMSVLTALLNTTSRSAKKRWVRRKRRSTVVKIKGLCLIPSSLVNNHASLRAGIFFYACGHYLKSTAIC